MHVNEWKGKKKTLTQIITQKITQIKTNFNSKKKTVECNNTILFFFFCTGSRSRTKKIREKQMPANHLPDEWTKVRLINFLRQVSRCTFGIGQVGGRRTHRRRETDPDLTKVRDEKVKWRVNSCIRDLYSTGTS